MKILCIADEVDPLVYSPRIKERFGDVDLVLGAGDLPSEYLDFISSMLNCPLLYVEGNHDAHERPNPLSWARFAFPPEEGARNIGFRIIREGGLTILGLPGSLRYNRGPNQFSDFSMALRIVALAPRLLLERIFRGRALDIVLTHASPQGIQDRDDPCHRGFRSYTRLIHFWKPRWFVHGHVHLYDLAEERASSVEGTTVVNAFGHWIIETEEKK
ncbi:MAG TPA: metallophosphoesterase [Rectinemataceae bacterium]|nr:metallophosphoesterase [Rectinemataceae bacterium]